MKKKLIVFTHGGGRLANQLTNYAHLFAFWSENKDEFDMINLAFGPYSELFENIKFSTVGFLPEKHGRLSLIISIFKRFMVSRENNTRTLLNQVVRLFHLLFGVLPGVQSVKKGVSPNYLPYLYGRRNDTLDFHAAGSMVQFRAATITLLAGWPIRSWPLFEKHQNEIRRFFAVNRKYKDNADRFIVDARKQKKVLVGVLMRQDDYRIWNDGKYFFSSEQYAEWMMQVTKLFPGKDIGFVLASDEEQSREVFNMLPVFYSTGQKLGSAHFIESFTELSLCDYVMTPPSTFGIWAAFLGNVPIIPVYEQGQILSESQILQRNLFDAIVHPHMSVSLQ